MSVIRKGARFSKSKGVAVWSVMVPANRLHEPSFGRGFHAFLEKFNERVKPHEATASAEYQMELARVNTLRLKRLQDAVSEKRRFLALSYAKFAGKIARIIIE